MKYDIISILLPVAVVMTLAAVVSLLLFAFYKVVKWLWRKRK